jgi:hypothetical protein
VCSQAVAVEYASRARARRYGVRRSEGVGGGRHGAVVERPRWKLIQTRVETQPYACLPGQERVTRRRRSSRAPKVCSEACMRWNGNAMRAELTVRCCVQIETDEALGCARRDRTLGSEQKGTSQSRGHRGISTTPIERSIIRLHRTAAAGSPRRGTRDPPPELCAQRCMTPIVA